MGNILAYGAAERKTRHAASERIVRFHNSQGGSGGNGSRIMELQPASRIRIPRHAHQPENKEKIN